MSYTQGTAVLITGTFTNPDTGELFDPPDVLATVEPPGGTPTVHHYTSNDGWVVRLSPGRYRFSIDTSPAAGEWSYELAGTGPLAIVKRRTLRVRPSL